MKKLPFVTMTTAALALLASAVPSLSVLLAYNRELVQGGEWWRVVTGHLVHWSPAHLGINLAAFLLLGVYAEQRDRRGLAQLLGVTALAVGVAFVWVMPKAAAFGGLSTLTFAALAWLVARWAMREESRSVFPPLVLVSVYLGMIGEVLAGVSLLALSPVSDAFRAMPAAHLMGAIVGGLAAYRTREALYKGGDADRE